MHYNYSWKKSYGVKEENRITDLLSVLMEMGRRDLAENIEAKYNGMKVFL